MRPAHAGDVDEMVRIASASGFTRWDAERFRQAFDDEKTRAFVSERGGFAIGWKVADELELHLVAVEPAQRRNGIATALLERFCDGATHLEVEADNTAARALYTRLGFEEVGRRSGYYGPNRDAVLMRIRGPHIGR